MFGVSFNVLIGSVAAYWGFKDKSLTLLGFGLDNFAEIFSAAGIIQCMIRKKNSNFNVRGRFEKLALQLTGTAFFMLSTGLLIFGFWRFNSGSKPALSIHGIIVSTISITVVLIVIYHKKKLAEKLNSKALYYDAKFQKSCLLFADVLLFDSLIYYFTGFALVEYIGFLLITMLSIKEGFNCFKQTKSMSNIL